RPTRVSIRSSPWNTSSSSAPQPYSPGPPPTSRPESRSAAGHCAVSIDTSSPIGTEYNSRHRTRIHRSDASGTGPVRSRRTQAYPPDLAGREVEVVVVRQVPADVQAHRLGRTGGADCHGPAVTVRPGRRGEPDVGLRRMRQAGREVDVVGDRRAVPGRVDEFRVHQVVAARP